MISWANSALVFSAKRLNGLVLEVLDSCIEFQLFDRRFESLNNKNDEITDKSKEVARVMEEWRRSEAEAVDEDVHAWTARLPTLRIAANEVAVAPGAELGRGSFAWVVRATWRCTDGAQGRTGNREESSLPFSDAGGRRGHDENRGGLGR